MNKEREKGRKEGERDGRRDGRQKTKSRGGILVARKVFTVEIYTVSIPEKKKNSICLLRGRVESLVNDDVSIVHARK